MSVHVLLRYGSSFGQSVWIYGDHPALGNNDPAQAIPLQYLNADFWQLSFDLPNEKPVSYTYGVKKADGTMDWELSIDRLLPKGNMLRVMVDTWNDASAYETALMTQPFEKVLLKRYETPAKPKGKEKVSHIFKLKAPQLLASEVPVLLGGSIGLGNWLESAAIQMTLNGDWWECGVNLGPDSFPIAYKYAVLSTTTGAIVEYETGDNRVLYDTLSTPDTLTTLHEGFIRLPHRKFKGAGVAIPVFSLRSESGFGVGEFTDIPALADWGANVGLKLLQLLPINDTSATGKFTDSYPYASISVFALHPLYINVAAVAGAKHAALLAPYETKRAALNTESAVNYVDVLQTKWEILSLLFAKMQKDWAKDPEYLAYFESNKHWLRSYAAFCYNRDRFGTSDFNQWPEMAVFEEKDLDALFNEKKNKDYDKIALHVFVQFHLHKQLLAATAYAHSKGMVVKGDIAIGIYRHSCDAWVAPELYNMEWQAGAPPDDFAAQGQNWGFPTYNWARMKADGYLWWRQRFEQLSAYFDAFRIDHILGFFRIWSTPLHAVEGILGRFVPAIPIRVEELHSRGIGFDYHRLCMPYITGDVLRDMFGQDFAQKVADKFLQLNELGRFDFKPEFDSQRKLEAWFEENMPDQLTLRNQLFSLHANVIFLADGQPDAYHFRIDMNKTSSYRYLPNAVKQPLQELYLNYFYKRQDDFWQREALEKLPALKHSTDMLICGEDLGMVPDCVPDVMTNLGILSLEIQRMPKQTGVRFFHPRTAPYLSVVTPSTHDMSTIRGWWEEDQAGTQAFYNQEMGKAGQAPFFCEPWIAKTILDMHFYSPAMWAIFQLQDLMAMDGSIRRKDPAEERINEPSNPKHYWQYRMHHTLAALNAAAGFNKQLHDMVVSSGRA